MIKLTLPDGSIKEHPAGITVFDATSDISKGLAREAVGAVINGEILGMADTIDKDGDLNVVKFEDDEGKEIFWHTASHVLALAVKRLFPQVKFGIGPAIDNGFYYDFDTDHTFSPEDLEKIQAEMNKIIKEDIKLEKEILTREEALKLFEEQNEPYKLEIINDLDEDATISIYRLGEFVDLCRGPHLVEVKKIRAIKPLSIAGAYWKGDEKNKMLQRIYGVAFPRAKMLEEHLEMLEEAKKRDHRKLGKELDLFSIHPEGPGFPFFHANGMALRSELINFWKEAHREADYGEINTPIILSEALWRRSGHWDHYKENMYFTEIDEEAYAIKPMNCPASILLYNSDIHSYRDFPIRWGELGLVHRHELSGTLHGLMRVRSFTQDDAHIFCLPEQTKDELVGVLELADKLYAPFGFKYDFELSTRPDDYMGTIEQWDMAENALKDALEEREIQYTIDEGDGAFYGPKIDIQLTDAIGRQWQCGTIQLDFQLPERFEMEYIDENNERKRPVMIHRAIYGSIERFIGILIEHYAGRFPTWLAPIQVKILPISDKFNNFAEDLRNKFKAEGIRVKGDYRDEKVGYKIREAQMEQVPYMLVIGQNEIDSGQLSVRDRETGETHQYSFEDFIKKLQEEIKNK